MRQAYNGLYEWLSTEQIKSLFGKYISIYQLDSEFSSIQSVYVYFLYLIQLNFVKVNSEILEKTKYSQ